MLIRPASTLSLRPWAQPTSLADRMIELETIRQRLAVDGVRLLTLTGPAGVGKTRLALAAAAQLTDYFLDGVGLVDLAPLRDPQLVVPTLAHALGVTDTGHEPLLARLQAILGERALLLVLDNFEQVLPAAAPLADLLATCPGLALLVTSRVPLRLPGEQALRVPPLPVPDLTTALPPLDELVRVPAVALFVARARARRADFAIREKQAPLVARLVVQLDGLPLALELAAARLDALSLPVITRRLEDRLQLLRWEAPDLPARQQSLEAAVDWSYDLLAAGEQRLFRHLGVFVGRVALEAIAAVLGSAGGAGDEGGTRGTRDGLASLAQKSLVLPGRQEDQEDQEVDEEEGEPAFGMLETVREYAWERLAAAGELAAARRAHAHYFLALAERADPHLRSREQRAWFLRLEREQDNLRAALRWLLDQEDDPAERDAGLRLAAALGYFWFVRGYYAEGARWLVEALGCAPGEDLAVRTQALVRAGRLVMMQGDDARAQVILEEAMALAEQRHDRPGIAKALIQLGARALSAGEATEGVQLLRAGLRRAREVDEPFWVGHVSVLLGVTATARGDHAKAVACYADALDQYQQRGDARLAGLAHYGLAVAACELGGLPRAVAHAREGLRAGAALQDRWLIAYGTQVALWLVGEGTEPARRARLLGAADALVQAIGPPFTGWAEVMGPRLAALRERLEPEGLGAAHREGRSLSLGEVAAIASKLLEDFAGSLAADPLAGPKRPEAIQEHPEQLEGRLSPQEREMLRLVAQGLANHAISGQLGVSLSTVSHHLSAIFRKLGVKNRVQAVAVAAQRGLL